MNLPAPRAAHILGYAGSMAFKTGLVDVGDRNWSRDNLYEK